MEKYSREIDRLRPIDTQHMREDELVNTFRNGKFVVKMCAYSFDLLMSFILDKKLWIILRLLNLYVNPLGIFPSKISLFCFLFLILFFFPDPLSSLWGATADRRGACVSWKHRWQPSPGHRH